MTIIDSRAESDTWSASADDGGDSSTSSGTARAPSDSAEPRPKRRATRSTRSTEQARSARAAGTPPAPAPEDETAGASVTPLPTFAVSALPELTERRAPEVEGGKPTPKRYRGALDESKIDPDVQKVVKRLVRNGHEAYLVGGCVRDILLGHRPKDFDVATSARPEEVRHLFRNSRVIGRRFRLVHILFHGGKVIEVATFRRNPREEEIAAGGSTGAGADTEALLIRADNAFGEAHEDATRRDFTINALFYDCESSEILDYIGGMDDIERRVVNTIGDPEVRFHEDPVRILRALKFAGKLDLGITPAVYDAIVRTRESLALAARPRVSEEILRLLRGGAARRTIFLAWETGVLDVLLPELSSLLDDAWVSDGPTAGSRVFRLLDVMDQETRSKGPSDDAVLWTLLLLEPLKEACDGARDRSGAVADFLEPLIDRLSIPRRFADSMRRILGVLPRLFGGKAGRFARTELFDLALNVARADLLARGESIAPLKALLQASQERGGNGAPSSAPAPQRRTPRR